MLDEMRALVREIEKQLVANANERLSAAAYKDAEMLGIKMLVGEITGYKMMAGILLERLREDQDDTRH